MSQHHHHHSSSQSVRIAFFLNLSFTIIELIGGLLTNSVAILSDALHDFGDSLLLGLAWYFEVLSHREKTESYSYGYQRYSIVGALINAIVLIVGSVFILKETIPRLLAPEAVNTEGMIGIAILGVLVNGAAVFKLRKAHAMNQKTIALHLLEDVLGWGAVLIGALIMQFFDFPIIDPLLSIGIALFILYNVIKNLKETFHIILQKTPTNIDISHLKTLLAQYGEVMEIHDVHVWSMDGEYNVLSMHLVLNDDYSTNQLNALKQHIREALSKEKIDHATLEFETLQTPCPHKNTVKP